MNMKSEWTQKFLNETGRMKEILIDDKHTEKDEEYFPRYIVKEDFINNYLEHIEKTFHDKTQNPFLKISNFQEYKMISLLYNLYTAKKKFNSYNNNDKDLVQSGTSQLIRVNNIIKKSYELTSLVKILDWLQNFYGKDETFRLGSKDKPYFEDTVRKLEQAKMHFNPDMLNSGLDVMDAVDRDKFNKIIDMIVIYIRQGKLEEAQKTAEYHNQFFISAVLNGGLPMNDLILDKNLSKFDFELLPPCMKTKELSKLKEISHADLRSSHMEVDNIRDNIIGNPNWLLWFHSMYNCHPNDEEKFHLTPYIKLIQSYMCGNPSYLEKHNKSVYDSLYVHSLNLLNTKVIEEYIAASDTKELPVVDYQFTDEPDKVPKSKKVTDVFSLIRSREKFQNDIRKDILTEVEFEFINLHFSPNKPSYIEFNSLLTRIIELFESSEFEIFLRNHCKIFDSSLPNEGILSQEEREAITKCNIHILRTNYWRILFTTLVTFYALNKNELFFSNDKECIKLLEETYKKYDFICQNYFCHLLKLTTDPKLLVYIPSFYLDLKTAQESLSKLARLIKDNKSYAEFVSEIDKHFKDYQEVLNTSIANNTSIYQMNTNLMSIDTILQRDLKEKFIISEEDSNKILQVDCLFKEGKLEKVTILKYVLKLALLFLNNNKFEETMTITRRFKYLLTPASILEVKFLEKYEIIKDRMNFIYALNSVGVRHMQEYVKDFSSIGIYFCLNLIQIITDCYFNFKNYFSTLHSPLEKRDEIIKTFIIFIKTCRVLNINSDLRELVINFLGEEIYTREISEILSKWIYQVLKWTVDLYTLVEFKNIHLPNDYSLNNLLSLLINDTDDFVNQYVLEDANFPCVEIERSIFAYITEEKKRKNIPGFIYTLLIRNRKITSEILDDELQSRLTKDIENFEF